MSIQTIEDESEGVNHTLSNNGQYFVAVCCENRNEWVLTDIASVLFNFVLVPMHYTLDIVTMRYILDHSESSVVITSSLSIEKVFFSK